MLSIRNTTIGTKTRGLRTLAVAAAAAVLAAVGGATPAHAGLTPLSATPYPTEQGQAQIFANTYGGTFVANGSGFTNGSVTATRVDDQRDVAWTGGKLSLTPVAAFSGSNQALGLMAGTSGGSYQSLFSVNQFGYLSGASSTQLDLTGQTFRFALDNGATNLRTTSLASDNGSGDQLVTYKIDGVGNKGTSTYMLFWEDAPLAVSDRDYNDLVVKATFDGKGGPQAVPLPPAVAMGLLVMGGTVAVRKWKQRRRARMA
jgi:hypothetical protein